MISTLNTPETNIHMVSRGLHIRENKILLDFLSYLKYNKFKISGNSKTKF